MHVHPHEDPQHRVARSLIALYRLRDQLGQKVFPVHRLDAATEGVMLMALSSGAASALQKAIQCGEILKRYELICRGWLPERKGEFNSPLERDSNSTLAESRTVFEVKEQFEARFAVSPHHATTRYSLVEAQPITGRWHQIRRHFARSSHPIVGDREHGDSRHNRYFRERLGVGGLLLRASSLRYRDSIWTAEPSERWTRALQQLRSASQGD